LGDEFRADRVGEEAHRAPRELPELAARIVAPVRADDQEVGGGEVCDHTPRRPRLGPGLAGPPQPQGLAPEKTPEEKGHAEKGENPIDVVRDEVHVFTSKNADEQPPIIAKRESCQGHLSSGILWNTVWLFLPKTCMYFFFFFFALTLSFCLTAGIRRLMLRLDIVDRPKALDRKIHTKTIPLGGGIAIFVSFFFLVWIIFSFVQTPAEHTVLPRHLWGLFFGSLVLMIGGILDDRKNLKARYQLFFAVFAALIIIAFGIGPHMITNPFGGEIRLDRFVIPIDGLGNWVVLADIVVFFWLMGMMFTTKLLDGLDGLVTGIVAIGALMIFFLSLQKQWYQPDVALLAIVFAGSCLGFLFWNWHPAKIFLGQGGSLFSGFLLGSLAIISGGKIATTLLVVGVPMLDMIRVMARRLRANRPLYVGDREHLHFKLLESGMSHRQAVLILYGISFSFGITTLFLQSRQKMVALLFLGMLMLFVGIWFSKKTAK